MYRLGRKQKRAILTEDGQEVVVFPKGKQEMAERVCRLLNAEIEVNKISSNPVVSGSAERLPITETFAKLRELGMGEYWDKVKCVCSELGRSKCELNCKEYQE